MQQRPTVIDNLEMKCLLAGLLSDSHHSYTPPKHVNMVHKILQQVFGMTPGTREKHVCTRSMSQQNGLI